LQRFTALVLFQHAIKSADFYFCSFLATDEELSLARVGEQLEKNFERQGEKPREILFFKFGNAKKGENNL
jgi:hypothetical protein